MRDVGNHEERDQFSNRGVNQADRQDCQGEFTYSDTVIEAMFAPCEAWLRMSSEIVKTCYTQVFWSIPAFCVLPFEFAQRSFGFYIDSVGRQNNVANLSAFSVGGRYSATRGTVDSIESAMDVAIGADREPPARASTATAA